MSKETLSTRLGDTLRRWADLIDPDHGPGAATQSVLLPGFEVNQPGPGSTALPPEMRQTLYELAGIYDELPVERRPTVVQLLGRASQTPPVPAGNAAALTERRRRNRELSYRRAHAVLLALREDGVVPADAPVGSTDDASPRPGAGGGQIHVVAGGEDVPWENVPDTEHPLNRSVEIKWIAPRPAPAEVRQHSLPWGTLTIDGTFAINGMGIAKLAQNVAAKTFSRGWPKLGEKINYLSLTGGSIVHVGHLEHRPSGGATVTRNVVIEGGVFSIAVKPPEPGVLDLAGLVTWSPALTGGMDVRTTDPHLSIEELRNGWLLRPGVAAQTSAFDLDLSSGWFFYDRSFRRHLATAVTAGASATTELTTIHFGVGAQVAKVYLLKDYDPHRSELDMLWEALTRKIGPTSLDLVP